ncbi:MAG: hypothetical protein ACRDUA_00130 [Micromonosporaceae bacterium]
MGRANLVAWVAYVDESMRSPGDDAEGLYVLAAAMIEKKHLDAERHRVTRDLALRGRLPFHWRDEPEPRRAKAVYLVAQMPALHLVVVGLPLTPAKQERGRRQCLARLLHELDTAGVEHVWLDSRRPHDNRRDIRAVDGFRKQLLISPTLRVSHAYPAGDQAEPLLWIPDIVAGMITGGHEEYRDALDPILTEHRIWLD